MTKPLAKYISVDPRKKFHFSVKKNVWGGIVERTFFNIRNNLSLQEYQQDECKSLIQAQ